MAQDPAHRRLPVRATVAVFVFALAMHGPAEPAPRALPGFLAVDQLQAFAARARPVIEQVTGRRYRRPVTVRVVGNMSDIHDESSATLEHLGLYLPRREETIIFSDTFLVLSKAVKPFEAQQLVQHTLIHELVHALDHQHGLLAGATNVVKTPSGKDLQAWLEWVIQKALTEGHAEHVTQRTATRLGLYFDQDSIIGVPGLFIARLLQEKPADRLKRDFDGFIYEDGRSFVEQLKCSSFPALIGDPPPCMHHVVDPARYIADREAGMLKAYQDLHHVLDRSPDYRAWETRPDKLPVDVAFPAIVATMPAIFTGPPRSLRKPVAAWFREYTHKAQRTRRLTVLVQRFHNAESAERMREQWVQHYQSRLVKHAVSGVGGAMRWSLRLDDSDALSYVMFCDMDDWLITVAATNDRAAPSATEAAAQTLVNRLALLRRGVKPTVVDTADPPANAGPS